MEICGKLLSDTYDLFLVMAAMFLDGLIIPTSVLCRIPKETFIPGLALICHLVPARGEDFEKEIALKVAKKKTSKKGNNSNMA